MKKNMKVPWLRGVIHQPVMLQEVLDSIPEQCRLVMDGTLGHGGHTIAMAQAFGVFPHETSPQTPLLQGEGLTVVWVDRDAEMIEKAKVQIERAWLSEYISTVQGSYAEWEKIDVAHLSRGEDFWKFWWLFDFILLDIWVNMDHYKIGERGFSIRLDGPLDMRFDTSVGQSAYEWVMQAGYDEMMDVFQTWADLSAKVADRFVKDLMASRKKASLETTHGFRDRAKSVWIWEKKLTLIFQAMRIHINGEMRELELFLEAFVEHLRIWGRCAIMTYHSGEDRLVKYALKKLVDAWRGVLTTKKVIKPTWKEVQSNKAARSAKMRVFEKICHLEWTQWIERSGL